MAWPIRVVYCGNVAAKVIFPALERLAAVLALENVLVRCGHFVDINLMPNKVFRISELSTACRALLVVAESTVVDRLMFPATGQLPVMAHEQ